MTIRHMSREKVPSGQKKYPYIDLGNKLRKLRGGLNQEGYATLLGVALRTYHRYEKGERKVPDGLLKLAILLDQNNNKIGYVAEPKHYVFDLEPEYQSQEQDLINMVNEILRSEYAPALAANIHSFYAAIQKDNERGKLKKEIAALKKEMMKRLPEKI
ncbi:hypothetical protein ES703_122421 [subsurface metagenome]